MLICDDALDDARLQRLAPEAFKAALMGALAGQETEWSPFLRKGYDRPPARVWAAMRARIFARDNYRCGYCGAGGRLECDHKTPVSRGGSHDDDNLVTACFACNRAKGAMTAEEFLVVRQ